MKINSLTIARLQNSDHFNFMKFTAESTVRFPVVNELFPTQMAYFKAVFEKENEAYLKSSRSFLTKRVQAANELRILRFRELNNVLKGAELCTETEKAEAAEFLLDIIKDYGGASKIIASRLDSISGILANLVEDFQTRFAAQVSAVGLTDCLEELRAANEEYIRLRGDRTQEVSEKEKEEMANARKDCDTGWHGLIDTVNWHYFYFKDERLVPYMKYMNTEVDWYRTILGQKPGDPNTNPDGGSEGEGGETTETREVTYTFNMADDSVVTRTGRPGEPVDAPEPEEDFTFVPTVPEVFGREDMTFREELIENLKTVYTFVLRNNGKYYRKGLPGEAFTDVPPTIAGYHWEPTPPATFGDEDLTFHEVADA